MSRAKSPSPRKYSAKVLSQGIQEGKIPQVVYVDTNGRIVVRSDVTSKAGLSKGQKIGIVVPGLSKGHVVEFVDIGLQGLTKKLNVDYPKAKMTVRSYGKPAKSELHRVVEQRLTKWVSRLDKKKRDEPIVVAASGSGAVTITPRTLLTNVKKGTPIGKGYVQSFEKLAVNHVIDKFGAGIK